MWPWIVLAAALLLGGAASAAETPKRGGTLNFAVVAEPPNTDCHATTTFAMVHPVAPQYSTLLAFTGLPKLPLAVLGLCCGGLAYILTSFVRLPYSFNPVVRFLYDVCEPYLRLFRRILPPLGPLDLSPIIAVLVLIGAEQIVVRLLDRLH